MDVPFFLSCNSNPNAQAFKLLPLGFRPVPPAVPQAHRLLSCNSVSSFAQGDPRTSQRRSGHCYSGSGPFRRDSPGAPNTIHRTGQVRPGRSGTPT